MGLLRKFSTSASEIPPLSEPKCRRTAASKSPAATAASTRPSTSSLMIGPAIDSGGS